MNSLIALTCSFLWFNIQKGQSIVLNTTPNRNNNIHSTFFLFFFKIWLTQSYNGWLMPMSKKHFCLTAPDKEFDPVTVSICKKPSTNADHYQKWQHTLQEVLALWISGNFHQRYSASHKFKKNRAKVNQVLLHHSNDENDLLFG